MSVSAAALKELEILRGLNHSSQFFSDERAAYHRGWRLFIGKLHFNCYTIVFMEIFLILFKSGLHPEEVIRNFKERASKYREIKGLVQKYYIHDESSGEFGGIYIFDSKENLEAFSDSDIARSIGAAQKFLEPPTRKVFTVNHVLYEN